MKEKLTPNQKLRKAFFITFQKCPDGYPGPKTVVRSGAGNAGEGAGCQGLIAGHAYK